MSVTSDILKVSDVVSVHCPYTKTLEGLIEAGLADEVQGLVMGYAYAVEAGEVACKHIFDGTCGFAQYAIEENITQTSVEGN